MRVKLKVLVGKSAGKEIPIPVSRFLIGRGDDCHMRPKSDAISRNHCAILISEDSVLIRDLNSRNGTFVNGEKIQGDCELKKGDKIRIGQLEFEAVIKPDKKAEKPAAQPGPAKAAEAKPKSDSGSIDFDVSDWLAEADAVAKARPQAEPDTRQFQLDETDQIALESGQEANAEDLEQEGGKARKPARPEKKSPGKLPQKPTNQAPSSREAAADMLKKFFTNR